MFITKATAAVGKLVTIKADIANLIVSVREALTTVAGLDTSLEQALIAIYSHRHGLRHSDIVAAAIAALDIPFEDVIDRLDRMQSYLVRIEADIEPFVLPLSHAETHLALPLNFAPDNKAFGVGDAAFALGGEAGAILTVSSFVPSPPADQWRGPMPSGSAMQELTVSGEIAVHGSVSAVFGQGTAGVSSSMGATGQINLFHQYPHATSRVAALVNASGTWAAPWDLGELHDQLQPVAADGSAVGLRRVQVQGTGAIALAGGVKVGKVISVDAATPSALDIDALSVSGGAAAGLDFTLSRNGEFVYVIEKDADGFVTIDLIKSGKTRTSRSLSLSADINVTGLDSLVNEHLTRFFEDPAGLLAQLEQWTSPGDRLVEELKPDDWHDPVIEKIGKLLLGEATAEQLSVSATTKLEEKLRSVLNEKVPFWGEDSSDVANQLVGAVADRLGLGAELSAELNAAVKSRLVTRIEAVNKRFDDAIKNIVSSPDAILGDLLKPFESVGENLTRLQQGVNDRADAVVEPARRLLKRYQDIRNKLLRGVEKVAQFKIGMAYAAELNRERGNASLLRFRIRAVNQTTKAIHRAFVVGRIDSVWSEFEAAVNRNDPWIDQVEGRFSAFAKRQSTAGFSLSFGESPMSITRVKASEVDVQISPDGTVLVAASKISQENIVKAFRVERAVGFSASYDLAVAARHPDAFPTPLGFNLTYDDQRLKTKELSQFLRSLEQPVNGKSLLSEGAAAAAVAKFVELRRAAHSDNTQGRVDVSLPVYVNDLARLTHIPNDKIRHRAVDLLMALFLGDQDEQDLLATLAAKFEGGVHARDIVFFAASQPPQRALSRLESKTGLSLGRDGGAGTDVPKRLVRRMHFVGRDADALVDAIDGVRGIATLQHEIAALPDRPPKTRATQIVAQLEVQSRQINDGLDSWLEARKPLSGLFTEAVPEMTLALLALIADLSGDDTRLVPVVSVDGDEGEQIVVI